VKLISALLFVLFCACSSTGLEVNSEFRGCTTDVQCDDGDRATRDWCTPTNGFCNHERDTVTTRDFDPASRERQNASLLCETDLVCARSFTGPYAYLTAPYSCIQQLDTTNWSVGRNITAPWYEDGYPMQIGVSPVNGTERLHVRLQLRVGDPRDRLDTTVAVTAYFAASGPVLLRNVFSVQELEAGLDLDLNILPDLARNLADPLSHHLAYIYMLMQPVGEIHSLAMQWALPPGGVTNLGTGAVFPSCLEVGIYARIPVHGFLHLERGPAGEPLCTGTPLRTDETDVNRVLGLVREEHDPTLYLLSSALYPHRIYSFAEGADDIANWIEDPDVTCGSTVVMPDGTLRNSGFPRVTIGVRPATQVQWTDGRGTVHHGIADRNFTIYEPNDLAGGQCSLVNQLPWNSGVVSSCALDLGTQFSRYHVVPIQDVSSLNFERMYFTAFWGYLE